MPKPKDHAGKDFAQRHGNTTKTGAVPRDFKPFRDRPVASSKVPCPECKQPAGERCVSASNGAIRTPHTSRRTMALRAEREATA